MFVAAVVCLLLLSSLTKAFVAEDDDGQIFSSTYKLKNLLDAEVSSVKVLQGYIAHQRQMIHNLRSAQKAMDEMVPEPEQYYQGVDHPINAYRLVNRFVAHWRKVYNTVFNTSVTARTRHQMHSFLRGLRPHLTDFHGSYKSLLRLQLAYRLNPKKMADGLILGQMSDPMDQNDCYNMALTAINIRMCKEALEWTRLAGSKAESEHERWEIHRDVDDFEQRLKTQDLRALTDVVQEYLAEAVGYEMDKSDENDVEEETVYQDEQGRIIPPSEVTQPSDDDQHEAPQDDEEDELDISDVASEGYVEGELNIAQHSTEMEEDLAAMDAFEYMQQLQEVQLKAAAEQDDDEDGSDVEVEDVQHDGMQEALKQAHKAPHGTGNTQSKCGAQPQVIEQRTVEFKTLGTFEGKTLKIRYQGEEIDDSELDSIEKQAVDAFEHKIYTDEDILNQDEKINALCRGEEVQKRDLSKLICRYRSTNLPYNSWREEIISREPMLSMIYNFVTESEMNILKELSRFHLYRAKAGGTFIDGRVQSTFWHADNSSTSILNLSKRVSIVTGLDVLESGERWQVGQYGIGGHYAAHYDYDPDRFSKEAIQEKILGDRIATFMMYISDVKAGGNTVFPHLGVFARPTRGAAVFWYNYSKDGQTDARTLHEACPVLMGHKWVANKWIHMYGNEFLRPCGRTKDVSDCHVQNI